MGKGVYTYYKERLVEISGNNRCLYLRSISKKTSYDLGRILEGRISKISEFTDFLIKGKKQPLPLICTDESSDIIRNLRGGNIAQESESVFKLYKNGRAPGADRMDTYRREQENKTLSQEVEKLNALKREVEEIERETGRYELYVGYPYVFGCIQQGPSKTLIKAPLLLFPVGINTKGESYAELYRMTGEPIRINPALIFAYAGSKKLSLEEAELEFDSFEKFGSIKDVIDHLSRFGIDIEYTSSDHLYSFPKLKEPDARSTSLSVRHTAVLARYPLSNSIYHDYTLLEKKGLTNDALNELLRFKGGLSRVLRKKKVRKKRSSSPSYTIKMLDYAQSEVVKRTDASGNMVIYGPPGTGKSQTIVNIITDAICKHKRTLVVSQKKAALDVVYNRLGALNEKAMYITDETKEKRSFYERALAAHQKNMHESPEDTEALENEYRELERRLREEEGKLEQITKTLNEKRPFGLSLSEMYSASENLSKSSSEYGLYMNLLENRHLLSLNYSELSCALFDIESMNLAGSYYRFMQEKEKNPLIDNMLPDLDLLTLTEVKGELEALQRRKRGLFNLSKHPYCRQILAYYAEMKSEKNVDRIVKLQQQIERKGGLFKGKAQRQIKEAFLDTLDAIDLYAKDYECLYRVLTPDGYISVIDNLLRGNNSYLKLTVEAIDSYISQRDFAKLLASLDTNRLDVLNFAYGSSKSYASYTDAIKSLMKVRIYHELLGYEESCKDELSLLVDYPNITAKIIKLKEAEAELSYKLCSGNNGKEYKLLYESSEDNKDYLYQISKTQKLWPVRKTMEVYGKFLLSLFPCWLLSPENVSNLLPLEKNLFDIVIFDEASQVFIENTIPSIYRGKTVVVAGDDKQLRPCATFMKRYLGADPEREDDYSLRAALEVTSLLDLAVSRYDSANLTYHYRSRNRELIDFSNYAFYGGKLRIAPNISKNIGNKPIERYKVPGTWESRCNVAEAEKIVELLKKTFKTRKKNESIGIITFNSEQQTCIADTIDREMMRDSEFRRAMLAERSRIEDGEDVSIFIKNLENVQGDERDIIIFSIGYAPNESGKVNTIFGSLSVDGGENRLNVAITRAKEKIIVVTSIEPEELNVEESKNPGPQLLRKYLTYIRGAAEGRDEEVNSVLFSLNHEDAPSPAALDSVQLSSAKEQIRDKLTKMGYTVQTELGNSRDRISLAIYDSELDRYLVGVELDSDAFRGDISCLERDVYKPRFLESRGWTIVRVWCRDWWLSPQRVIRNIASVAEANKKRLRGKQ